ncbi:hypothetical protein GCM10010326_00590 [Streptomyces xanthochromogenes]|uniref:Uncharacterized protein n=1 Tax=Streptomyces xanthochromogenes TaxID=67384 RepID=A0ABQ2ZH22_9ACTN|nr:hypothetical protein GCM10010326_00590 [Streptomyces xanthochromogenes]
MPPEVANVCRANQLRVLTNAVDLRRGEVLEIASRTAGDRFPDLWAGHASHDVDALRLVVGEETSLPRAVQAGAERLIGWLTDPRDADFWRARAALPPRQPV